MYSPGAPSLGHVMKRRFGNNIVTRDYIWKKRFVERGSTACMMKHASGRPRAHDDEAVAELLAKVLHDNADEVTYWSVRSAASQTGISKSSVACTYRYLECSLIVRRVLSFRLILIFPRRCVNCRSVPMSADQRPGALRRREEAAPKRRSVRSRSSSNAQVPE